MKYLFPEELRKFGFVPVEEYNALPEEQKQGYIVPVFLSNGCFSDAPENEFKQQGAGYIDIIAVQVAPVPCEKVKVWGWDRTSYGEVRLSRYGAYTTIYNMPEKTDAQAQELCDLLEKQEG